LYSGSTRPTNANAPVGQERVSCPSARASLPVNPVASHRPYARFPEGRARPRIIGGDFHHAGAHGVVMEIGELRAPVVVAAVARLGPEGDERAGEIGVGEEPTALVEATGERVGMGWQVDARESAMAHSEGLFPWAGDTLLPYERQTATTRGEITVSRERATLPGTDVPAVLRSSFIKTRRAYMEAPVGQERVSCPGAQPIARSPQQ